MLNKTNKWNVKQFSYYSRISSIYSQSNYTFKSCQSPEKLKIILNYSLHVILIVFLGAVEVGSQQVCDCHVLDVGKISYSSRTKLSLLISVPKHIKQTGLLIHGHGAVFLLTTQLSLFLSQCFYLSCQTMHVCCFCVIPTQRSPLCTSGSPCSLRFVGANHSVFFPFLKTMSLKNIG